MKTKIIAAVMSVFFSASVLASDAGLKAAIAKCKTAVVVVIGYDKTGREKCQGTGFFVGPAGQIATNAHVVDEAEKIGIKTTDGKKYFLNKVISSDETADMFIFSVEGIASSPNYLRVSSGKAEEGDPVYVIGTPMGLEQTVSTGIVSGIRKKEGFGFYYQITAPISPGSSGSPVMNDSGQVIGIATMQFTEGQNLNFVMPSEKLTDIMTKNASITFEQWSEKGYSVVPSSEYGLLKLGERLYEKGKYKEAMYFANMLIKKNAGYAEAYNLMAECLTEEERRDDAYKYIKYAAKIGSKKESFHNSLGVRYADIDMDDLAAKEYYQEININPKNYMPYYNLAALYARNGMLDDAFAIIDKGIKVSENPSELYAKSGDIYMKNADSDIAFESYKKAVEMDPYNEDAYYGMGRIYVEDDDKQGAMDTYRTLSKISVNKADRLYMLIHQHF
jgi:tetratricopeptide (TPR) repeat protein